jgi:hypothetical protein
MHKVGSPPDFLKKKKYESHVVSTLFYIYGKAAPTDVKHFLLDAQSH